MEVTLNNPSYYKRLDVSLKSASNPVDVKLGGATASGGGTPNAVQFVPQELTEEQQAQARENINAVDADSIPEWAMQPNKPTYTKREIGLGNVDNVEQYSEKNPPPYPVTSVNNKKGSVNLSASDVGADANGTAASAVNMHDTSDKAHNDIRLLIEGLAARLSGIADSDDTTLDQLSEIVAYIKSNKSLIDSITTSKVNVSDIINNLTSNVSNKPLSAAQGVVLKALIDGITIPTKVSQLTNDKGYLTSFTESDPTVPSWAKQDTKPSYTKSEVGLGNVDNVKQYSANNPPPYPVTKVNGKTGDVVLDAESVGARANNWMPTYSEVGADKSGTASSAVNTHNTNESAHNDIRLLIEGLATRLNALANSTDEDLDQMAEIVAYIKSNKELIDSITTSKVSVADIVNNLATNVSNKPLSAAQGVALKALIDQLATGKLDTASLEGAINTALSNAKASGEFDGADGKTPARGTDYWTPTDKQEIKNDILSSIITQEAGESESLVMSQKAVTDLVAEAIGSGGGGSVDYETVDSVEEMTDTSKQYVLKETGTLWTYGEVTENVNVNEQIFDASKVFTGHISGVNISSSSNKMYPMPVDVSKIPEGVDVYVDIKGFYIRNTTSPYLEKVGYSALENPKQANSQVISGAYAAQSTSSGYLKDAIAATSGGCKIKVGYIDNAKLADYDTIKTMLLEVKSDQTHDASKITAYLQYSYSGTVSKWYNTEITPSASGGGGGGNYVDLLVKVNKNTSDIYEVDKRVTALESGSESVTIPTFWEDAVAACIAKIKAVQVGRNCLTFPFFSDNHQRNGYAGMLIAHIMKECSIPYCFYGGDSISNGIIADEATMIAQDKAFDTMMSYVPNGRVCRAVGNHDGYWYDGTNKYYYNRSQVYDLFLREESVAQNKHFGGEGTYYYVDEIASKIRFIVMDTNGGSVDAEQIAWVQNTALSFAESGWSVVFISHQPISNHYHAGIANAAAVVTAVTSTANANSIPIIGWFSGHVHRDILATKLMSGGNGSNAGTEGASLGFTQVVITSDHTGIAYDDATKHTIANDDQSHAIDFVTINKTTRTVNITRLGIGNDRSYTY